MKRLLLIAAWLLGSTPVFGQALPVDKWTPAFPTHTERAVADAVSWGTALVPVILDAKASWYAADRRKAFLLQGTRLGVTYGVGLAVKRLTHRDRPCVDAGCGTSDPHGSFYSLHTALPFQSVGGPRLAFVLPFAIATGGLRIGGGKHWLTDVVAGAGAGLLTSRIR